jgi:hypothetical protein
MGKKHESKTGNGVFTPPMTIEPGLNRYVSRDHGGRMGKPM